MTTPTTRGGFPLSAEQADIVDHVVAHPVTVVAAGAGSGKTHTSIATVLHLIETEGASIDQFVLITFTRKAAGHLREKVQDALGERARNAQTEAERFRWRSQQERLSAAYIGTIHSFCRWMLIVFAYSDGVARETGITFAATLKREAIEDLLEAHLQSSPTAALYGGQSQMAAFALTKLFGALHDYILNQGHTADEVLKWTQAQPQEPWRDYRIEAAQFAARAADEYARRKQQAHVLDAHDLLRKAAALFRGPHSDWVWDRITDRYQYLFVDEFQDTDAVQMDIVEALRPSMKAVLVVGDIKQSIYAYRGAQAQLMQDLAARANTTILEMTVSRRPTRRLLAAQTALFTSVAAHPPFHFLNKALQPYPQSLPAPNDPAPVWVVDAGGRSAREEDRIAATAGAIRQFVGQTITQRAGQSPADVPVEPGHIAVLGRSNPVCERYAAGLDRLLAPDGIRVRLDKGESFYRLPEVVSTTYMLQLLLEYPDDPALILALDTPYLSAVDAIERVRQQVQDPKAGSQITRWFKHYHKDLADKITALKARVPFDTVPQIIEALYRSFEIRDHYTRLGDLDAVQNLDRLREIARSFFSKNQALTLHTFVEHLRRATLTAQDERFEDGGDDGPAPHVRVMTMHRAKGLEFPVVVIPETQAAIVRSYDQMEPDFIVLPRPGQGLEIKIDLGKDAQDAPIRTVSPRYDQALARAHVDTQAEEMRVFYVAVTRAENVVVLVGSGDSRPKDPSDPWFSWRDEILRAWPALQAAGAQRV